MEAKERIINQVLARVLGKESVEVRPETHLQNELGVDSTEMVDIVCALQKEFSLPDADGVERSHKTVADLHRWVGARDLPGLSLQ